MVYWLLIAATLMGQTLAFSSQETCWDAASKIKIPVMCVAFAADVPDGLKK